MACLLGFADSLFTHNIRAPTSSSFPLLLLLKLLHATSILNSNSKNKMVKVLFHFNYLLLLDHLFIEIFFE